MGKRTDKTVIFDFDGTLANTVDVVVKVYNDHADDLRIKKVTTEDYSKLRTLGYKKAMKYLGIRWYILPKLIVIVRREMKKHMHEAVPYKGIEDMLSVVGGHSGVSIGILTSNEQPLVQEFLDTHDFPSFDFVISEKAVFGKHKALKKIMKSRGITKEQVIYVGDEPRDVIASNKAGVRVFGVTWGLGGVESMEPAQPDKLFTNVTDLQEALLEEVRSI